MICFIGWKAADARAYSPLALAFLGDSVFALMVRERLVCQANRPAGQLHTLSVQQVRAEAQAEGAKRLLPYIRPEEVVRRFTNVAATPTPGICPKTPTARNTKPPPGWRRCLAIFIWKAGMTGYRSFSPFWSTRKLKFAHAIEYSGHEIRPFHPLRRGGGMGRKPRPGEDREIPPCHALHGG